MVAGGVDATILNHPTYSKAVALGFSNLGDTKPYAEDIPFTVWGANMPWAEKNRDALTAFARSYRRGVRYGLANVPTKTAQTRLSAIGRRQNTTPQHPHFGERRNHVVVDFQDSKCLRPDRGTSQGLRATERRN
jgi:ABC-type nitrate/sulfonate/bicarbonate transport system substrate-binding protein